MLAFFLPSILCMVLLIKVAGDLWYRERLELHIEGRGRKYIPPVEITK